MNITDISFEQLKPLPRSVLVTNMEKGEKMIGQIIIRDDNGKTHGIRPRWAKVLAVGKDIDDIKANQWVLIEHGRWTRAMDFNQSNIDKSEDYVVHGAEYKSIMMVSDNEPVMDSIGDTTSL